MHYINQKGKYILSPHETCQGTWFKVSSRGLSTAIDIFVKTKFWNSLALPSQIYLKFIVNIKPSTWYSLPVIPTDKSNVALVSW